MKRLLKYLKSYKKECVLGPLFKMFEATLELIVPLVIASIVDRGIGDESVGFVIKAGLFLLLLGAVGLCFSLTAQYFSAKAAVGFVGKLRYALFEKVGTLSYSDIDELGTATSGDWIAIRRRLSVFVIPELFRKQAAGFITDHTGATVRCNGS